MKAMTLVIVAILAIFAVKYLLWLANQSSDLAVLGAAIGLTTMVIAVLKVISFLFNPNKPNKGEQP